METMEFVIRPDGRVEMQVQGIAGTECTQVSHLIEQDLGQVTQREWTAEYFQTVQPHQQDVTVNSHY
ncbi:hypothetical protein GlitD10_1743 [Gloeomargarita lithophora Alchichica-D10]|uniref:DUF2997 domain-containing protein n=1 Tax=Gloeomargarita lithophora Alchichica-D10 TaxID=1188229 RepID=A0A1J0ADQ8_9CYAN|nr:DUF2997 domain-containing protein [Gloeomargarita lithophora]APB34069.1 hypothetical protein GlitD10_1743 [Gloeomargarita lithophora Alchichica-D10]